MMKEGLNRRERESYRDSATGSEGGENTPISDPITRRRFLERSGGATAATVLALHGIGRVSIAAEESSANPNTRIEERKHCTITHTVLFADDAADAIAQAKEQEIPSGAIWEDVQGSPFSEPTSIPPCDWVEIGTSAYWTGVRHLLSGAWEVDLYWLHQRYKIVPN